MQTIDLSQAFNDIVSILCLNGELPQRRFFHNYTLPIVACDGAGTRLIKMGVKPQIIIGDLDSIEQGVSLDEVEIIHAPDQNHTDFSKALNILEAKNMLPCLVLGATGRQLDHTLNNISILLKYAHKNALRKQHIIFHDANTDNNVDVNVEIDMVADIDLTADVANSNSLSLSENALDISERDRFGIFVLSNLRCELNVGDIISILPFPTAVVSTTGLKWNLDNCLLEQQGKSSARNMVNDTLVEIKVHQGTVLVLLNIPSISNITY